ncbi:response regulator [Ramlibacter tataouinensis]|uniref:Candidate response regulator, CheY n=1 Tax=Ramlibacter tataouinensis (strain ATCC BAA-407 / DSM 14655 / LMG 21543 / TTB310) TaxID=365046 RepID=F5Y5Y7_RAMTT|nr:response regulator [Ramlibacter tataouinensis]AEG91491.1 candidate response regulator, CheY [Ramlibacter tataouinensis TTB310]
MIVPVVVVEDSLTQRAALLQVLGDEGFRVLAELTTEAEAKQWLACHAQDWGLAVIDLILQQGTGMRLIRQCRADSPFGTIVVLSNYVTPGIREHCLRLGAHAVFQKADEFPAFVRFCRELAQRAAAGGRWGHA